MTVSQSSSPSLSNHNFLSPNFPQTIQSLNHTTHTKNKNEQFSFNSALPFTFLFSLDLHSFNSLKKNYRQNPPIQPLPFPLTMEATSSDDHHNSSSPPIDQEPITHSSSSPPPPSSPRKSIELNPDSLTIEEKTTEEAEVDGENKKEEEDVNKDTSEAKEEEQPEEQKEVEEEETNLLKLSEEIDKFLTLLSTLDDSNLPTQPEIPISLERFVKLVEIDIVKNNSAKDPSKWLDPDSSSCNSSDPDNNNSSSSSSSPPLLESVDRISKLISKLGECHLDPKYPISVNRTSSVLQRAMAFLEEEFRTFLETGSESEIIPPPVVQQTDPKAKKLASFNNEPDRSSTASEPGSSGDVKFNGYSAEVTSNLKRIATAMISAGYEAECCQAYSIARRTAFEENLSKLGFEKISIDDIQKMNWESLEGEIATWIRAFKRCITVYFTGERNLCDSVYSDYPNVSASLFSNLTRGVIIQLLNFAEAVAMTKRSAEKLFKFLDMYETMRDLAPQMDDIFSGVDESFSELKAEISTARCRLGEAVVSIFCDLENSIKSDTGKTPVPGGAVHPLTRYTMNYLKYACEYKDTLEQVFIDHKKIIDQSDDREGSEISTPSHPNNNNNNHNSNATSQAQPSTSPFANQLMNVMDLLDSNLEAKSKLYKDLSLRYIFLMNNGRYIMQKIKGTNGIYHLMGDTWSRKRSSDLRQYHKNYQRETWSKVLGCLKDEGLQVNGKVQKPVLKERFKSFNAMFEEIHKAQSSWIVSDEQLQSELRVSISAVMIPAYRSFLGRFRQYLDSGRQSEKYIKYGPEDIETSIDELFDGNPASMVRRRT